MKKASFSFVCIALLLGRAIASAGTSEPISLTPESWQGAPSVRLSEQDGHLRIKSLDSSIWFGPRGRISHGKGDVVSVDYRLRGGNLVVQANWFDGSGKFLETADLGQTNSDKRTAMFRVEGSDSLPKQGLFYELKFWVEADMPSLELRSLSIDRGVGAIPLFSAQDFEGSDSIEVSTTSSGLLAFRNVGTVSPGSIVTSKTLKRSGLDTVRIKVASVSPSTAFSIQAIYWSGSGTYLGYGDLLKDVTNVTETTVDFESLEMPEGTQKIGFKFWLSGQAATAEVEMSQE